MSFCSSDGQSSAYCVLAHINRLPLLFIISDNIISSISRCSNKDCGLHVYKFCHWHCTMAVEVIKLIIIQFTASYATGFCMHTAYEIQGCAVTEDMKMHQDSLLFSKPLDLKVYKRMVQKSTISSPSIMNPNLMSNAVGSTKSIHFDYLLCKIFCDRITWKLTRRWSRKVIFFYVSYRPYFSV